MFRLLVTAAVIRPPWEPPRGVTQDKEARMATI